MIVRRLDEMVGGWVVGDFDPVCLRTRACEMACKYYTAGDSETAHVHRVAVEITVIAAGRARMNGRTITRGDVVVLAPGEPADFTALDDTITMVVKMPSVPGDKYPVPAGDGQ
jgi:hypothetical protein